MSFFDRWLKPRVDTDKNILLTGVPRSGTTLCCHLLNRLPDCVALHEPMEVRDLARERDGERRLQQIHTFLHQNRRLITKKGRAISLHRDGVVPENPVVETADDSGVRQLDVARGEIKIEGPFSADSTLVIKHPAVFTGLLPLLVEEFKVFAVIRNPLAVLGSWMTVPFGMSDGHAPAAENVDELLKRALADIDEVLPRQLLLLAWFFTQYKICLPESSIIRYEDIVASGGKALQVIVPSASQLNEPLDSRNKKNVYDAEAMRSAGAALKQTNGPWWTFYSQNDIQSILDELPS